MTHTTEKQEALLVVYPALRKWVDGFLVAKRAKGATPGMVAFLSHSNYYNICDRRSSTQVDGRAVEHHLDDRERP